MYVYCLFIFSFVSLLRKYVVLLTKIMYYNKDSTQCRIVRSLQDRIAFIINIYQHNKFIQSVISTSKNCKIYTSSCNSVVVYLGGWMADYNIQITNFCRITTCNERRINRVHLKLSLY